MVLTLEQLNTFFLRCQFVTSERNILLDDLCLIDPSVINFDGESLLISINLYYMVQMSFTIK